MVYDQGERRIDSTVSVEGGYRKILCPFDTEQSNYVKVLTERGFEVTHSHIFDGIDFFDRDDLEEYDAIVSNPPFSKREAILSKLFASRVPFAMILNFNGLFDSKKRWEMFKANDFELIVPLGRMHFIHTSGKEFNAPNFQSIYVCSGMTDRQIEFVAYDGEQLKLIPTKGSKNEN